MFWNKTKTETPKASKKVAYNKLDIRTPYGIVSWICKPYDLTQGKIRPWLRFYKWYFGKTTEVFVMRLQNGEAMIRRCDIQAFEARIGEATE